MARLTDEDLERLLRETFADKEDLLDSLPQATKPRRPIAPILLAAATVLVVLGGILYGVNRGAEVEPTPPVASSSTTDDADIWAAAIVAITQRSGQPAGLQSLYVAKRAPGADDANQEAARTFSTAERNRISAQVIKDAGIQVGWLGTGATTAQCIRTLARVSVGEVVDKGDHKEVRTSIAYNCGSHYTVTYRIEKRDDSWTVTGIVGVPEGAVPSSCPVSGKTPASPEAGC
ncbi:hypothetical protein EV652_11768 [Kribbella steppae]|uniref:Uncharacterized protein n=1 Tax=Kribbella steppae TaxID=2512223 RepID=A0A4R2H2P6_9ACTN|nr:hypothetical protein [Kribbella steppae]TCO17615.1 hypothetical protein EV652_11768 [Kribbella steppae]